jgi:hypothetical protein
MQISQSESISGRSQSARDMVRNILRLVQILVFRFDDIRALSYVLVLFSEQADSLLTFSPIM